MTPLKIPACFDLAQTLDCGQAFRWSPVDGSENVWHGAARGKYLKIERSGDDLLFYCSREDFDNVWRDYFDLDEDYGQKQRDIAKISPVLDEAIRFAPGIRILRQEPWEALCSFIISQNNNIPRIKGIIRKLCDMFGEDLGEMRAFPSPSALKNLTEDDLAPLRSGYRAKYLIEAAKSVDSGSFDLDGVFKMNVAEGRGLLLKLLGVGPKVADCVLLYGFHKTECFPLDVWMKRAMAVLLPDTKADVFGENAGLAQQYIFHYSRLHPELFAEESPKATLQAGAE